MLKSCPMCSRPFPDPEADDPNPLPTPSPSLESLLLDEHGIESALSQIVTHGKSDASKVTAAKYLTTLRAQRAESQSYKGWPAPETKDEYKERLTRILRACGRSLVEETLAAPDLWTVDVGL